MSSVAVAEPRSATASSTARRVSSARAAKIRPTSFEARAVPAVEAPGSGWSHPGQGERADRRLRGDRAWPCSEVGAGAAAAGRVAPPSRGEKASITRSSVVRPSIRRSSVEGSTSAVRISVTLMRVRSSSSGSRTSSTDDSSSSSLHQCQPSRWPGSTSVTSTWRTVPSGSVTRPTAPGTSSRSTSPPIHSASSTGSVSTAHTTSTGADSSTSRTTCSVSIGWSGSACIGSSESAWLVSGFDMFSNLLVAGSARQPLP